MHPAAYVDMVVNHSLPVWADHCRHHYRLHTPAHHRPILQLLLPDPACHILAADGPADGNVPADGTVRILTVPITLFERLPSTVREWSFGLRRLVAEALSRQHDDWPAFCAEWDVLDFPPAPPQRDGRRLGHDPLSEPLPWHPPGVDTLADLVRASRGQGGAPEHLGDTIQEILGRLAVDQLIADLGRQGVHSGNLPTSFAIAGNVFTNQELRQIGADVLEQRAAAVGDAERRASEEYFPGHWPAAPTPQTDDPERLAAAAVLAEAQDLAVQAVDVPQRPELSWDEWVAKSSAVLEANGRVFGRPLEDDDGPAYLSQEEAAASADRRIHETDDQDDDGG